MIEQDNELQLLDDPLEETPEQEIIQQPPLYYRTLVRKDLAEELYHKIFDIVIVQKKYRDPDYTATRLAKELKTNTRYLSAVVNSRFSINYPCLVNEYRVKESLTLLTDQRFANKSIEEISTMVGFGNRQSFYNTFQKLMGEPPNEYRKKRLKKAALDKPLSPASGGASKR